MSNPRLLIYYFEWSISKLILARNRIIGKDECPHEHCGKMGRYATRPMISWNTTRKFDKKREYSQFIHNDGSRHNIEKYSFAKSIKGKYFEWALIKYREIVKWYENHSRILRKYSEMTSKYPLLEYEKKRLDARLNLWKKALHEFMNNEIVDEIFQLGLVEYACKTVGMELPTEVIDRIRAKVLKRGTQIKERFDEKETSIFYAQFPVYEIIYNLHNKYELPERRRKKQQANKKQSNWPMNSDHVRDGII